MMAHKKMDWSKALTFTLFLFSFPAVAFADWEDILAKFRPRITTQEQYLDNLFYTNTNKVSDYITTIAPGLTFSSTESKEVKYGLDLDYAPGFVSYAHNSQLNYISHTGTLNTWYTFGQHLTLRLWEYFIRSDSPWESYVTSTPQPPGVYYLGTNQTRSVYTRNVFQPSLTYRFGPEDLFEFTFQDNAYANSSPTVENYHFDTLSPRLTYWFNIRNGIILEYRALEARYQISPDFIGQRGRVRYSYRFTPHTSIFGEYIFDAVNYEYPGINYYVQNPSIGMTHAFSPTLSGRVQAGYFFQTPQAGNTTSAPTFESGINQRTERTTFDLSFRGGYQYAYGITPGTTGFTKYYQGIGSITYQLAQRLSAGIVGWVGRYEYAQTNNQIDWIWQAQGNLSYQILRWLTASFTFSHQEDNSSLNSSSYKVNSAMIRLTAGGPNLIGAYPLYPAGAYPSGMYPLR